MNPLEGVRLELTKLLGKKELTFGCIINVGNNAQAHYVTVLRKLKSNSYRSPVTYHNPKQDQLEGMQEIVECMDNFSVERFPVSQIPEILNHPATLSDFHRYANDKHLLWEQDEESILIRGKHMIEAKRISYISSKDFLDQGESTLGSLLALIKETSS